MLLINSIYPCGRDAREATGLGLTTSSISKLSFAATSEIAANGLRSTPIYPTFLINNQVVLNLRIKECDYNKAGILRSLCRHRSPLFKEELAIGLELIRTSLLPSHLLQKIVKFLWRILKVIMSSVTVLFKMLWRGFLRTLLIAQEVRSYK